MIRVTSFDELITPSAQGLELGSSKLASMAELGEESAKYAAKSSIRRTDDGNALTKVRREPIIVEFLARQRGRGGRHIPIDREKLNQLRSFLPPSGTQVFSRRNPFKRPSVSKAWVLQGDHNAPDADLYLRLDELRRLRAIVRGADAKHNRRIAKSGGLQQ